VTRAHHLPWALTSRDDLVLGEMPDRPWREFEADHERPTDDEWRTAFGEDVSRSHQLTAEQMDLVARVHPAVDGDLDAAVRRLLAGPLVNLARRVRPRHTWDDIVLSPDRLGQLQRIVNRYRHAGTVFDTWGLPDTSGRGIVALFSGASGTGKTLAAEIVAGALELDMFKLDLSSVVSKYIGETEKNLEQVFSAASAGNVVLFFDEADSLFGKRSEVKDARDRYANLEVSYLLQRLEAYDGVVVMATNFQKNIDEAFLRRIHVLVDFPSPGAQERREIWRRHLGTSAPVADLDVDWLADTFEISGGIIRNAVVDAAFQASADGSTITMAHLAGGVLNEQRKAGRLIRLDDYAPHLPQPADADAGDAPDDADAPDPGS
jgi:AAA+ superfamily predicted ATPase